MSEPNELLVISNDIHGGKLRLAWLSHGDEFDFGISVENARGLVRDIQEVIAASEPEGERASTRNGHSAG